MKRSKAILLILALALLQTARRRLSRLGKHLQVFEARKRKAKTFFESGMSAFQQERWLEAAGSVRLAIAFDPGNEAYKEAFADVQRKAHEERAKLLIKQGEGALTMRDYRDAAGLFEEALQFRPFDPELNIRAARLIWQTDGDLRKAKEFATAACEIEPDNAGYRRTLGQVFKAAGLKSNARRELEAALKLAGGRCMINSVNLEDGEERLDTICCLLESLGLQ